jgi:hypothetical protein
MRLAFHFETALTSANRDDRAMPHTAQAGSVFKRSVDATVGFAQRGATLAGNLAAVLVGVRHQCTVGIDCFLRTAGSSS